MIKKRDFVNKLIADGLFKTLKELSKDDSDLSNIRYLSTLELDFLDCDSIVNFNQFCSVDSIKLTRKTLFLIEYKNQNFTELNKKENRKKRSRLLRELRLKFHDTIHGLLLKHNILLGEDAKLLDFLESFDVIYYRIIFKDNDISEGDIKRLYVYGQEIKRSFGIKTKFDFKFQSNDIFDQNNSLFSINKQC